MKVFVTGATGFVGTAVTRDLLAEGHQVLGLARSDRSAAALEQAGAAVLRGDLETPDTLRAGAARADAVIHTGFIHDFARFADCCAIDRAAIETLGEAIAGTAKPLIVTAGVAFLDTADRIAAETDRGFPPSDAYPRATEAAAEALSARGIPVSVMRLPPSVHGRGDHGFVPMLIDIARRTGRSVYIGDGGNAWPAVHVSDAARAFRLAAERGAGVDTWHAVAESNVPFRVIAEAIAAGLDVPCVSLPVDAARAHFGWFFGFASLDQPTSSDRTRAALGWSPAGPDLITDIREAGYFPARAA
ncbi:SDR family oxidoreductase [Methylobrevis albus]|uniref:SDR family oxidoreductase n=1 Tax=Methylobrevis albus TaxID=2793297 RepID=A0A931N0S7_9HYPH|nr:SDR family oxidoreductase [Methylobrevis albus]MBH0239081.1 SDR family oxidoreductase [Methylobrevis albus]